MITSDMIRHERERHFIGETFEAENIIITTDHKSRIREKVRVIELCKHFMIVTNGKYNWCIEYKDMLLEDEEDEQKRTE